MFIYLIIYVYLLQDGMAWHERDRIAGRAGVQFSAEIVVLSLHHLQTGSRETTQHPVH
jgi:hypothetical protein